MGARLSLSWGPSLAWSLTAWRPMILTPADAELTRIGSWFKPWGDQDTFGLKGVFRLQHPVRLYFPFLKCQEYLQCSGEKVLVSFQCKPWFNSITMSLIQMMKSKRKKPALPFSVPGGGRSGGKWPGGKGRDRIINRGWQPERRGGLCVEDQLLCGDSSRGRECSSFTRIGLSPMPAPQGLSPTEPCSGSCPPCFFEDSQAGTWCIFCWVYRGWGLLWLPLVSALTHGWNSALTFLSHGDSFLVHLYIPLRKDFMTKRRFGSTWVLFFFFTFKWKNENLFFFIYICF